MTPANHALQIEAIHRAICDTQAALEARARQLSALREELTWIQDGNAERSEIAMEVAISACLAGLPSLPDWPQDALFDPAEPVENTEEAEAELDIGCYFSRAAVGRWRFDAELWPATLAWAVARGALPERDRAPLHHALQADRSLAFDLLSRVEHAAHAAGRTDLVFGSRQHLATWGVQASVVTAEEEAAIWRVLGGPAMRGVGD